MLKTELLDYGLPTEGTFTRGDGSSLKLGRHLAGGWQVEAAINQVVSSPVFDSRTVQMYQRRPPTYDALFKSSVNRFPHQEAVICEGRRLTYLELDKQIDHVASGFINTGLKAGDRIGVMLDNCLEYVVSVLACVRAGGIAVPIGTRLGPVEIAHILENAAPSLVITNASLQHLFEGCQAQVYLVDGDSQSAQAFSAFFSAPLRDMPKLHEQDVMMIIYTSGTTGKPKGACLSHINFVHTCLHYLYALALDEPQRSLLVIPATHIAGFGPLLSVTFASGGSVYLMKRFTAKDVLQTIAKEKITYAVLVPTMYKLCSLDASFNKYDLSSWIYGVYGGAIMPPSTVEYFASQLPSLRLINAYGATETCAVCTIMAPEETQSALASVGLPLECDEILIVDDDFNPVPVGQPGEIVIRGPNVFPYYWNNPEATNAAFHDGYWLSGDVGSRDSKGFIYVHDRKKDMINRGGFKVFSAEVENALIANDDIVDCAVVGVPDEVLGEKVFAYVQIVNPAVSVDMLKDYMTQRVADYKVPDYWLLTCDPVPRNQNGKVQKAEIKEIAAC